MLEDSINSNPPVFLRLSGDCLPSVPRQQLHGPCMNAGFDPLNKRQLLASPLQLPH